MQNVNSSTHWPSLLTFITCLTAAILMLSLGGLLIFSSLITLIDQGYEMALSALMMSVSTLFMALLLVPGAYLSYKRMSGIATNPSIQRPWLRWTILGMVFIWPLSLVSGYWAINNLQRGWLLIPFVNLLASGLPIAFFTAIALNRVEVGPRWRAWSVFGLGMTIGPLLLIIAEVILFSLIFVLFLLYVGLTPGMFTTIQQLSSQLESISTEENFLRLLGPILANPSTLLVALFTLAIGVPIIEELLKPIGVWLFADYISSPHEGFALGILSGAAYALFETLGASTRFGTEWASLLIGRSGTSLLHILTTGLTSWALVSAWREHKYRRLAGIFTLSVLLHAVWNSTSVLNAFGWLMDSVPGSPEWLSRAAHSTVYALGVQAGIMFLLLGLVKRRLITRPATGLQNETGINQV